MPGVDRRAQLGEGDRFGDRHGLVVVAKLVSVVLVPGQAADGAKLTDVRAAAGAFDLPACVRGARTYALLPAQVASLLAARPYDLRHACVSLWLNAGVPATEVAARAGHSVDVLLKVYAKCIDGQRDQLNGKIDDALGEDE